MLKELKKKNKTKKTQEQNNTRQDLKKSPRRINHKATKSKTNTRTCPTVNTR